MLEELHGPEQLLAVLLLLGCCGVPRVERRRCRAVLEVTDGRGELLASQLAVEGKLMPSDES